MNENNLPDSSNDNLQPQPIEPTPTPPVELPQTPAPTIETPQPEPQPEQQPQPETETPPTEQLPPLDPQPNYASIAPVTNKKSKKGLVLGCVFGLVLLLIVLGGLGAVYAVAYEQIELEDKELQNRISMSVQDIAFMPKTPKYVLQKSAEATQDVKSMQIDTSFDVKLDEEQIREMMMLGVPEADIRNSSVTFNTMLDANDSENPVMQVNMDFRMGLVEMRMIRETAYLRISNVDLDSIFDAYLKSSIERMNNNPALLQEMTEEEQLMFDGYTQEMQQQYLAEMEAMKETIEPFLETWFWMDLPEETEGVSDELIDATKNLDSFTETLSNLLEQFMEENLIMERVTTDTGEAYLFSLTATSEDLSRMFEDVEKQELRSLENSVGMPLPKNDMETAREEIVMAQIWINAETFQLEKIKAIFEESSTGSPNAAANVDLVFSRHGENFNISAPVGAVSLEEAMESLSATMFESADTIEVPEEIDPFDPVDFELPIREEQAVDTDSPFGKLILGIMDSRFFR